MKILLDENLPHALRHFLPGHDVYTVAHMRWSGRSNGDLLRAASGEGFDVLLTNDSGVEYQQNLIALPVGVLVIRAKTNKLDDIRPLLPQILLALSMFKPNTLVRVG